MFSRTRQYIQVSVSQYKSCTLATPRVCVLISAGIRPSTEPRCHSSHVSSVAASHRNGGARRVKIALPGQALLTYLSLSKCQALGRVMVVVVRGRGGGCATGQMAREAAGKVGTVLVRQVDAERSLSG